jgi:uncharacterized phage-like protein YoqJ
MHELGIYNQTHDGIAFIKTAIERQLRTLLDEGLEWVIISGQLGTEMWAAEVALELKSEYPSLKLAITPPFEKQEEKWKEDKQSYYHSIIQKADFFKPLSNTPYKSPIQFKQANEFLLARTDGALFFYEEERESNVKYMKELAEMKSASATYPLYFINFYDVQSIVEEKNWE